MSGTNIAPRALEAIAILLGWQRECSAHLVPHLVSHLVSPLLCSMAAVTWVLPCSGRRLGCGDLSNLIGNFALVVVSTTQPLSPPPPLLPSHDPPTTNSLLPLSTH
jgi:hypothetical protein